MEQVSWNVIYLLCPSEERGGERMQSAAKWGTMKEDFSAEVIKLYFPGQVLL